MKKRTVCILTLAFAFFAIFFSNVAKAEDSIKTYTGELGYSYSGSFTEFKIWSASAKEISVVVDELEPKKLNKDTNTNVWVTRVQGDLSGKEYHYNVRYEDGTYYEKVLDPYGRFLNYDETRNIVYSDSLFLFNNWVNMQTNLDIKNRSKIIYGIDIANFTKSNTWNGTNKNRSKLLGLIETGTSYNNVATGYEHVKNLGITFVELSDLYNNKTMFGINRNFVSGEFGYSGAYELKTVVSSYYYNNIGLISSFDFSNINMLITENLSKIDKDYFNSTSLDLSKEMTRKYIEDVLLYWVKEFKLSGVRFENMQMFDYTFINEIANKLLTINENLFIYGDASYSIEDENKAGQNNLSKMDKISMENSSLNYALFGDLNTKETIGILDGNYSDTTKNSLKFALLSAADQGDIDYSKVEGISYKKAWENKFTYQLVNNLGFGEGLSLYDKLIINNITGSLNEQKIVLAIGTLMISGGVPRVESGVEFMASYQNFENRENSICTSEEPTAFCFYTTRENKVLDWSFAYSNKDLITSFKSLVNFRKSDTYFVQEYMMNIKKFVKFYDNNEGVMGYTFVAPDPFVGDLEKVLVLFNYSNNEYNIEGFGGEGWQKSFQYNLSTKDGDVIKSKANSIYLSYKIMPQKINQWILLAIIIAIIGGLYYFNIVMNKKLVEQKGYDIKDISKKYRPFINVRKNRNNIENKDENVNEENNQETLSVEQDENDEELTKKN